MSLERMLELCGLKESAGDTAQGQRALTRIQTLASRLGEISEVRLENGAIIVEVEQMTARLQARLPGRVEDIPVLIRTTQGARGSFDAKQFYRLCGRVDETIARLGSIMVGGTDPESLLRVYTVLPADLTTLNDEQTTAIVRWFTEFPPMVLHGRLIALEDELQTALRQDRQIEIRNVQIKMRHVGKALAMLDTRSLPDVTEDAHSRHAKIARHFLVTSNRVAGRGYHETAAELKRRARYHEKIASKLKKAARDRKRLTSQEES